MLVHHEIGVGDEDLVARADAGEERQHQPAGDAGGDEVAVVAGVPVRQFAGQVRGDFVLERADALRDGVAVLALLDGVDRGFLDDFGHVEVGLTDRQVDRVGEISGQVEHLADARGVDGAQAVGDEAVGVEHENLRLF